MSERQKRLSRREFIKTTGAAGIGSILTATGALARESVESANQGEGGQTVPTRPFGKSGEKVSILALGGDGNFWNRLMMRQAIKWGVTFWDTWDSDRPAGGGISQSGVGKYFKEFPDDRKKVFVMSKTDDFDPESLTGSLDKSLEVMNVDHIDFFVIHSVWNVRNLNPEIRAWVDNAKSHGKIRYFGVSSHRNMEDVMFGAAKLGWVDGVMVTYNYRVMNGNHMKQAVRACKESGLAIIAMKTQAASNWHDMGQENETAKKLTDTFIKKGYTLPQAKLKAVWQNSYIASITSMMMNMTILKANVEAALDRTKLSIKEQELLKRYAGETASNYCAGCGKICESALSYCVPVSDVMRYLMYARTYEDKEKGRHLFNQIPQDIQRRLISTDYYPAETRCPQNMPIGRLMKEAVKILA
ncbi:aldo/keto reductase [Thermodesulfobacteriota bacterium]